MINSQVQSLVCFAKDRAWMGWQIQCASSTKISSQSVVPAWCTLDIWVKGEGFSLLSYSLVDPTPPLW